MCGGDCRSEPAMTWGFVMPDVIGHLVLSAGKRLPVEPAMTGKFEPAMTGGFVMPDVIGHLRFVRV